MIHDGEMNTTRWTGTPGDYGAFWETAASSATKRGHASFRQSIPPDTRTPRNDSATHSTASTADDFWRAFWDAFLKWFAVVLGVVLVGAIVALVVTAHGP